MQLSCGFEASVLYKRWFVSLLTCSSLSGKSRKRRKGGPAAPPPLLLVQDPQAALNRIQERVSSLLLRPRPPTPPTPKLPPSALPLWTRSAPLWLKSALPGGGPDSVTEFYCLELEAFIQPVRPEVRCHFTFTHLHSHLDSSKCSKESDLKDQQWCRSPYTNLYEAG